MTFDPLELPEREAILRDSEGWPQGEDQAFRETAAGMVERRRRDARWAEFFGAKR